MTIIVFDPAADRVYVDSWYSFSNGRPGYAASKLFKCGLHVGAFAGAAEHVRLATSIVGQMIDAGDTMRKVDCHLDMVGFVRSQSGIVYYVSTNDTTIFVGQALKHATIAEGSGASWYDAYIALGMTVEQAITSVCELHSECGLPIETF